MKRRVTDLSPAFVSYRRFLEDSDRRIFNVPATHVCWEHNSEIVTIDPSARLYGCLRCGRVHECLDNIASCPVRQSTIGTYVCAFSGSEVAEADYVLGTWDYEQMALNAARLSEHNEKVVPWVHTTKADHHNSQANRFSTTGARSREFRKAEHATELIESVKELNRLSRVIQTDFINVVDDEDDDDVAVDELPPLLDSDVIMGVASHEQGEGDDISVDVMDYYDDEGNGEDEVGERISRDENLEMGQELDEETGLSGRHSRHGHDTYMTPRSLAEESLRRIVYSKDERSRDCQYQRRLFAPLVERLKHLAPHFKEDHGKVEREELPHPSKKGDDMEKKKKKKKKKKKRNFNHDADGQVKKEQQLANMLTHIKRHVSFLVNLFDEMVAGREAATISHPILTIESRIQYYTVLVHRIIELTERRALETLSATDFFQRATVILLELLSSHLRLEDSENSMLYVWAADPWLRWCRRQGKIVQILLQYDKWRKQSLNPYSDRLAHVSRKRKRRESTGDVVPQNVRECPVNQEALAILKSQPEAMLNTFIQTLNSLNQHGSEMRKTLCELGLGPIALYASIHRMNL